MSRIVAAGGCAGVWPWMQAIADAIGRPMQVSGVAEGMALRATFVAAGLEFLIIDATQVGFNRKHR